MPTVLATVTDVADVWRPLSNDEQEQVYNLLVKASAKLRHACPFDLDQRIALYGTDPSAPTALDPAVVADVVATIVKRFLVNVTGYASTSESVGPYSKSGTFVNRYDKTGSDVRGAIQVIESDIDQLRPAVPAVLPGSFRTGIAPPRVLVPNVRSLSRAPFGADLPTGPAVIPDPAYIESDAEAAAAAGYGNDPLDPGQQPS